MSVSRYHRQIITTEQRARASWDPSRILLPVQFKVSNDNARLIVIDGPRRIGKSKLAAVLLLETALKIKRARCLFLALTRDDARDIVWQELRQLNEDYALGGTANEVTLELVFRNGSRIRLGGAKDRTQAERRRGRFYDLVIIDECQTFPSHLRDLVEAILKPSLLGAGRRGRIVLMGTPGEIPGVGYWEERVNDPGWSKHGWTTHENTSLGTKEEIDAFLAEMAESMKDEGGWDAPRFQREFLGNRVPPRNLDRPFIYDVTKQHFEAKIIEQIDAKDIRLTRWELPLLGEWRFVFGIDLGSVDASAICVWGATDAAPGVVWLVEEFISVKMLPDQLWARVNERRAIYKPLEMAIDQGGLGKMIADQWRAPPYSLPVVPADKLASEVSADFLSAAMARGAVRISKFSRMAADMAVQRWDSKELAKGKRKVALDPHSDIIPAGRYGFKKIHAIATSLRIVKPPLTIVEKVQAQEDADRKEASARARAAMTGRPYVMSGGREALAKWRR